MGAIPLQGAYDQSRRDFSQILSLLSPDELRGATALDIGCGRGYLGAHLFAAGCREVGGVEPFGPAALEARTRLTWVLQGEFPDTRLQDRGPFDIIVMADSLEHIVDTWAAMAQVRELLAPNGRLLLSVPNVSHYTIIRQLLRGDWTYTQSGLLDRGHVRFFTPQSLCRLLRDNGLTVERQRCIRSLPRRGWRPLAGFAALFWPHVLVSVSVVVASRASRR